MELVNECKASDCSRKMMDDTLMYVRTMVEGEEWDYSDELFI